MTDKDLQHTIDLLFAEGAKNAQKHIERQTFLEEQINDVLARDKSNYLSNRKTLGVRERIPINARPIASAHIVGTSGTWVDPSWNSAS